MNPTATLDTYAAQPDSTTLRIQRLLPGPIERVWAHLVESELRRKWFAAGDMKLESGAPLELVWRNDELTDPPGHRPEVHSKENRMQSRILDFVPLRELAFAWGTNGATVRFELEPKGNDVMLTVTHRGVPDRNSALSFGSGWHAHLGVLAALLTGERPRPFWDEIARLKGEYETRLRA
jgi:uncharacterized protein YndB with AHSA1/START domain